jgi:hypothetical protein
MGGLSVVNGCVLAQSAVTFPSKADVFYTVPSGRRSLVGSGLKVNAVELSTAGAYEILATEDTSVIGKSHTGSAPDLNDGLSTMVAAYDDAASRDNVHADRKNVGGGTLGGAFGGVTARLTPGVYTFTTDVSIASNIYIDGTGTEAGQGDTDVFIMQIKGDLVQADHINVYLSNGALAKNIFWQVEGSVTVGAGAHMAGILMVKTDVLFGTDSSMDGRVLSQSKTSKLPTTIAEPSVCGGDVFNPDSNPHISPPGLSCCPLAPDCTMDMGKTGDTICPGTAAVALMGSKTQGGIAIPSGSHIEDIIYGLSFSGDSNAPEVSFKVDNPFDVDVAMYLEYEKKVGSHGAKDPACAKDPALGHCKTDALEITAACMRPLNEAPFAVFSVFFVSTDPCFGVGSDSLPPFECCEQEEDTLNNPFVKYTFKILCECPATQRRLAHHNKTHKPLKKSVDFLRGRTNHFHDSL